VIARPGLAPGRSTLQVRAESRHWEPLLFTGSRVPHDSLEMRLQRARHEGREAFHAGQSLAVCPYELGGAEGRTWLAAWEAARLLRERIEQRLQREG
jgi:ribosome modulation factor